MLAAHCMAAARKALVESMMASGLQAACTVSSPCTLWSNKEGLKRRFAGFRILWLGVILPWLKQDQFAGDRNAGRQDNIQARITIMGKCHANPGPVCAFFALHIGLTFLGDKYVVHGFSHDVLFNEMVKNNIFDHIPIRHSGFNGLAGTFSGTLN